jgi:hypothetical protein
MKKLLTSASLLVALSATLLTSPAFAAASPPNAPEMKKLDYIIGTWNCTWTAGTDSGAVISTFTSVMNGAWLQETEAVQMGSGEPQVTTMHFTGYDPRERTWMHLGPNADGTYEVARSADLNVWHNVLPVAGGDAAFQRISDREFSLSEPFQSNGQTLTYLETCKKAG